MRGSELVLLLTRAAPDATWMDGRPRAVRYGTVVGGKTHCIFFILEL